jgi:hypothetical protein
MGKGLKRSNGIEEVRDDTRLERQGCFSLYIRWICKSLELRWEHPTC